MIPFDPCMGRVRVLGLHDPMKCCMGLVPFRNSIELILEPVDQSKRKVGQGRGCRMETLLCMLQLERRVIGHLTLWVG